MVRGLAFEASIYAHQLSLFALKFHYNFTRNANSSSIVCCTHSKLEFFHVIYKVREPHERGTFVCRKVTAHARRVARGACVEQQAERVVVDLLGVAADLLQVFLRGKAGVRGEGGALTTMSMVSSNSILMISMRVFLWMVPVLSYSPPRATKASKYSSVSPSKLLISSYSLYHLTQERRLPASSFSTFLLSNISFIFF